MHCYGGHHDYSTSLFNAFDTSHFFEFCCGRRGRGGYVATSIHGDIFRFPLQYYVRGWWKVASCGFLLLLLGVPNSRMAA